MARRGKMLMLLAGLLVMAGCVVQPYVKDADITGYPNRHRNFDYHYAWKAENTAEGVVIEGVMKNVRYFYIDSITLTVELLDRGGNRRAGETEFPRPQLTREGDVSRFGLLLRGVTPAAGDSFRFTNHYTGSEGNDEKIDWISIFSADALTGRVISPAGANREGW